MDNEEKLKRKIQNSFKLSGFNVRREFCTLILEALQKDGIDLNNRLTFDAILNTLCTSLETQCLIERSIERENVEKALNMCLHHGHEDNESILNIINCYDFPKLSFNQDRKRFYIENKKSSLLPEADMKAKLFLDRYTTVLQRTKRNFQQNGEKDLKLQTVDYLLTLSSVTLDRTLILGALFQISEGKWCLEDPTGMVELNLIHAKFHIGFFNESCLVLVNGYYEDRVLHVSSMVLPPGEDYKSSRPFFGNINYFGGASDVPLKDSVSLKDYMFQNKSKNMMFFSDVWLDHPQVFDKLESLFNGLQDCVPVAFVFLGNFMSNSHGSEMMDVLMKLFKRLGELILKFPTISSNSNFVFVPGMADPCTPYLVPRFALPDYVTSEMKRLVPKAVFATNPCRIQYCTREIVVFRADVISKLLQCTLHKPSKDQIPESIRRTIISQGHLSPLSLNSLTVHWDFDYCLRLYPLPDVVVIGDKHATYEGSYKECHVVNPGSFCENAFQFLSYTPFTNVIDECTL